MVVSMATAADQVLASWRSTTQRTQRNICLICGKPVIPCTGSWDHLVPAALLPHKLRDVRVGLAFYAHQDCNSRRGVSPPTAAMIERAASIIIELPDELRALAEQNVRLALRNHGAIFLALDQLVDLAAIDVERAKPSATAKPAAQEAAQHDRANDANPGYGERHGGFGHCQPLRKADSRARGGP